MLKAYNFIFICCVLCIHLGCSTKKASSNKPVSEYGFKLTAVNLSEDFSNFSTKNDELLILIYPYNKDTISDRIATIYHEFTAADPDTSFTLTQLEGLDTLLFCFVEIDHNTIRSQSINDSICAHFDDILTTAERDDYITLESWFDDDDFLFTLQVPLNIQPPKKGISFKGKHKLDKFSYKLNYWTN